MNKLTPKDVPGAELPNPIIEHNSVPDLKRWLSCRGISHNVNKTELQKR